MSSTEMRVNGLTAGFNMPKAVVSKGAGNDEWVQGLPPYAPQDVYVVDEYAGCPDNWMRGNDKASSYFVGVKPDHGMWLDFNGNRYNTHDVAVLISIQGINPVTGKPTSDNKLEQYKSSCPVHNIPFGSERFCSECKYKWPPQNYLATTGTPNGLLWLDGFMTGEGVVRQYIFTADSARGVAAQIIGDQRVFAVGIAFYLSKNPKPVQAPSYRSRGALEMFGGYESTSLGASKGVATRGGAMRSARSFDVEESIEIGAGAKIEQRVYEDPKDLDYWETEPAGTIYVNYAATALVEQILAGERVDRTNGGEGALGGLVVGNPFNAK